MPNPEKTDKALSDAARAVVRDPGDPRIDAHLAALGLGPDAPDSPDAPAPTRPRPAAAEDDAAQRLADATTQLAEARAQHAETTAKLVEAAARLEAERRRVRTLAVALVIAVGFDIVLLAARLAG